MPPLAVEICVQDARGAQVALQQGADRIEVCSALDLGGLTPSIGTIQRCRDLTERSGWLHVLVRPRPGGYVYDEDEVALTCADIRSAVAAGADGVVVGALRPGGEIDASAVARFLEAAAGRTLTFHRAIDVVVDLPSAVLTLSDAGVDRVLTSGGRARALDGTEVLSEAAAAVSGSPFQVMAGGGVRPADVPALAGTGVHAVHLSAKVVKPGADAGPGGSGQVWRTDAGLVAATVAAAR